MMAAESPNWRDELLALGVRVRWQEPLARYTSFKIGGPADALVWADTREQLAGVAALVRRHGLAFLALGRGTNLLVSDQGRRGVVLKLGRDFEGLEVEGDVVRVGAAVPMSVLSKECAKHGLSGAEFLFGIPGSVGGGARMNAGAHGRCFADITTRAEVLEWEGAFRVLDRRQLAFAYRRSALDRYVCATEIWCALRPDDPDAVERRTKEYYHHRLATQPLSLPSAGCVFRNPDVGSAGKMIDECGLKGLSVGGARVSEKHANFIVAPEAATAEDVLRLIAEVRRRVKEKTGADLELEIQIVEAHGRGEE
jgi:UDP-N-acetylmuramate dehydrogenase